MKVLVYINSEKDVKGIFKEKISSLLSENGIEYLFIRDNDFDIPYIADALFVYGGDGTILDVVSFSCKNNIPLIAINSGKLGFLAEFEEDETGEAIKLLLQNKLIRDERLALNANINGKEFIGLNEIIVRKIFLKTDEKIVYLNVKDNKKLFRKIKGDGILLSTPTGSTAYAYSIGNCILYPELDNFSIMPIAPHSVDRHCLIVSADNKYTIELESDRQAGVFIDGEFVAMLNTNEKIEVKKHNSKIVFLRREDYDFYETLKKVTN